MTNKKMIFVLKSNLVTFEDALGAIECMLSYLLGVAKKNGKVNAVRSIRHCGIVLTYDIMYAAYGEEETFTFTISDGDAAGEKN